MKHYCINCKHSNATPTGTLYCALTATRNIVTGYPVLDLCSKARYNGDCGVSGKQFEPAPPTVVHGKLPTKNQAIYENSESYMTSMWATLLEPLLNIAKRLHTRRPK